MKYFVLSIWLAGGCGGGGAAGRGDGPIAPVTPVTRGGSTAAAPAGEPFPLAPGAEWTFRGTTRSGDESGNVVNLTVTWKMKVLDVIERAGWHAAAMQGHPRDVVGFGGDAQASEYLILWKDGRYYEPGEAAATLARLRDPKDDLAKLVSEDDLILRLPLAVGDKYCPADSPDELSPRYCWSVESNEAFARAGIAGAPTAPSRDSAWTLWMRTSPDHAVLTFVPGLGFVAYEYEHHGTLQEADLKLVAFRPGGR